MPLSLCPAHSLAYFHIAAFIATFYNTGLSGSNCLLNCLRLKLVSLSRLASGILKACLYGGAEQCGLYTVWCGDSAITVDYLLLLVDWGLSQLVCTVLYPVVFKPDELRQALMPTLERLYKQDPESIPFRQAVDPVLLQIPVSAQLVVAI